MRFAGAQAEGARKAFARARSDPEPPRRTPQRGPALEVCRRHAVKAMEGGHAGRPAQQIKGCGPSRRAEGEPLMVTGRKRRKHRRCARRCAVRMRGARAPSWRRGAWRTRKAQQREFCGAGLRRSKNAVGNDAKRIAGRKKTRRRCRVLGSLTLRTSGTNRTF